MNFLHTKEQLLSYFKPPIALSPTLDTSLGATVEETLLPLCQLPLTELEKKLFSSNNLNSEGNRRSNYSKKVPKKSTEDSWDMPSGVGNFGSDGVFMGKEKQNKMADVKTENKFESLLEEFPKESKEVMPHALQHPVQLPMQHSVPLPVQPLLSAPITVSSPTTVSSLTAPLITPKAAPVPTITARETFRPMIPPFNFQPQGWIYRDPSGASQGPFSAQQMQDWYTEGFFSTDLPIKHVDEATFQPLGYLINRFGPTSPFLAELEESHSVSRLLYERKVLTLETERTSLTFGHSISSAWESSLHKPFYKEPETKMTALFPLNGDSAPYKLDERPKLEAHQISREDLIKGISDKKQKKESQYTTPVAAITPIVAPSVAPPSPSAAPWASKPSISKSFKEIQDTQQIKETEIEKVEKYKEITDSQPSVWGSSKPPQAPNQISKKLSEIMLEEETKKSIDPPAVQEKRYADLVQTAKTYSSTIKSVVGKPSNANLSGWSVVGKKSSAASLALPVKPTTPVASATSGTPTSTVMSTPPSTTPVIANVATSPTAVGSAHGTQKLTATTNDNVSSTFLNWFKSALQHIPPSAGVNAKTFLSILLSISLSDKSFIMQVCDDTLGGITSIDANKFGEEFIRRRTMDLGGRVEDKKKEGFIVVGRKKSKNKAKE